jgi:glyoxylase-like metal-dependent hydrolase (beta-lactamase superfamily II)
MARIAGWLAAGVVLVAALIAVYAYRQVSTLELVRVTDDVHVIHGFGSNVGILRTDAGSLVVDTMTFPMQGREIRERARAVAGPVQVIVNTHYHLDHTHGNPAFAPGLEVISTVRTRAYLDALDADYWRGDAARTLPNATFDGERTLRLGGKTIRLFHPGRGHTDGDLVALFVEDRVVHTGDLFFNGRYPNIDLEAGGSVREWVASIDRILELEFDRVIPGHGPVTDRDGLRDFQRFMQQLAASAEAAARGGLSLAQHRSQAQLDADAGYEVMAIPFVMRLDRDFVLRRAWEEANGAFEPVRIPGGE